MLRPRTVIVCFVVATYFAPSSAEAQVNDHYWFHDPPYVDPFFNQDGSAKTNYANGYTTRPRHPGHAAHGIGIHGHGIVGFGHGRCGHCGHGVEHGSCTHCGTSLETQPYHCAHCGTAHGGGDAACSACGVNGNRVLGRRGPLCPEINTARLQVYVPDCHAVEVNGQKTRPQTLGGIHRNSRIFELDGLSNVSASPTDVVIVECDLRGNTKRHTHVFYAQAGQQYQVRFPADFTLTSYVTPDGRPVPGPWPTNEGQILPPAVMQGVPTRPIPSGSVPQVGRESPEPTRNVVPMPVEPVPVEPVPVEPTPEVLPGPSLPAPTSPTLPAPSTPAAPTRPVPSGAEPIPSDTSPQPEVAPSVPAGELEVINLEDEAPE